MEQARDSRVSNDNGLFQIGKQLIEAVGSLSITSINTFSAREIIDREQVKAAVDSMLAEGILSLDKKATLPEEVAGTAEAIYELPLILGSDAHQRWQQLSKK